MDVAKTGHMAKDKECPKNNKNNKDKKKMTVQIYAAREDESEESEPYGGSQYSLEGEEAGFKNESKEEEKVRMHIYRNRGIRRRLRRNRGVWTKRTN